MKGEANRPTSNTLTHMEPTNEGNNPKSQYCVFCLDFICNASLGSAHIDSIYFEDRLLKVTIPGVRACVCELTNLRRLTVIALWFLVSSVSFRDISNQFPFHNQSHVQLPNIENLLIFATCSIHFIVHLARKVQRVQFE